MTDNTLSIKKEADALRKMYSEDPRQKSFNALVLGESGSGKSFLMSTAIKPVHADSFDPGGLKGVKKWIESGEIIPATQYESEDPRKPHAFKLWKEDMARRAKMGYFNEIGTYWLDSSTTWGEAIMNDILRKAKIPGEPPRWAHDYVPQKALIRNWLRELLDLPCNFILTGHLEAEKDEVTGGLAYRYMTTGKGTTTIPLLFDEIWVMEPKKSPTGVNYRILTQATGTYIARSRLAQGGLLDVYEDADLKAILRKVGLSTKDKPLI